MAMSGFLCRCVVIAGSFLLSAALVFDSPNHVPFLITTWPYEKAVEAGWKVLTNITSTAVDAIEATGTYCELHQCLMAVGFGANPDESGETTLDAMIMDGTSHNVGAVGDLRRVMKAISVARRVLENTRHTLLVGDQATQFAVSMGFTEESLTTAYSRQQYEAWKQNQCQPNFRENVTPDPRASCGPYSPSNVKGTGASRSRQPEVDIGTDNHDTIGIIAIDRHGNVASGTSTNGLRSKIPGRVGDSPIAGAGSYADSAIGGAACTGNGDIMMRFLPSYKAVSLMGQGVTPSMAAAMAIDDITPKYPNFVGAVVAADKNGNYGAACHNWNDFAITVIKPTLGGVTVVNITCH